MNIVNEQPLLKSFFFVFTLGAIINTQAMEKQEEEYQLASMGQTADIGQITDFVEKLHRTHKSKNQNEFAELINRFNSDIQRREHIEQLPIIVEVIQELAPKNELLTNNFSERFITMCKNSELPLEIVQDIASPLFPHLQKYNRTEAIKKITCIFAGNPGSTEYHAMQSSIQHDLLSHNAIPSTDNDEELARALQDDLQHNNHYDAGLVQGIHASLELNENAQIEAAIIASMQTPSASPYVHFFTDEELIQESEHLHTSNRQLLPTTFYSDLDQLTDEELEQATEQLHASSQELLNRPPVPPVTVTVYSAPPKEIEEESDIQEVLAASTQFSAPSREEVAELEEQDDLSIAIEESLQNSTNNAPSFLKKARDFLLGGFGS